jgi:hypothetical protein
MAPQPRAPRRLNRKGGTMRKLQAMCALCAALTLFGAPALGASAAKSGPQTKTAEKTAESNEGSKRVVVGTVSEYKTGHSIAVKKPDGSVESFDLEDKGYSVSVDPAVKAGGPAIVVETVQPDGRHILTVTLKR